MLSCVECQSSFDPKRPKQVFCSDNCRKRHSKRHRIGEPSKSSTPESIMRRCVNCGSPIELPKSQQVFCDNKCCLIFFTYIAHQSGDSVMLRKGAEDRIRDLKIYVESYPEIVANYGAYKPSEAADHPATIQASGMPSDDTFPALSPALAPSSGNPPEPARPSAILKGMREKQKEKAA